ncbi:hypothetical protein B9Z19DRAFT_737526 [Tuber borchii]|uniref:Secreted protein n=1 Tax=Tuber borchii TaxID=42251 RepID=A0A2T6ZY18_TUBBO|nr:hypothetical protein B9Z19DRAFT_737526 [Tuber borchii]
MTRERSCRYRLVLLFLFSPNGLTELPFYSYTISLVTMSRKHDCRNRKLCIFCGELGILHTARTLTFCFKNGTVQNLVWIEKFLLRVVQTAPIFYKQKYKHNPFSPVLFMNCS